VNKNELGIFTLGTASSAVRDPSFPRIAAKAALELDGAVLRSQHKPAPKVDVGAVTILAFVVRRVAEKTRDTDSVSAMLEKLDAATTNVFLRAYGTVGPKVEPWVFSSKTAEVANVLMQVAEQAPEQPDVRMLQYVRNFCRALSSQASEKQRTSISSPTHAFLRKFAR
jgi:hypothetical protein